MGQYDIQDYTEWKRGFQTLAWDPGVSFAHDEVIAILDRLPVESVIVERDYIDVDYSRAYSQFYSHQFKSPGRTCTRYAFWGVPVTTIDAIADPEVQQSFLGFITQWPTHPPVIGRSVLPRKWLGIPLDTVAAGHHVIHIAGVELQLDPREFGPMFASKDYGVSACATVATWLSTDILHRQFDLKTCSSTEITLRAAGDDPRWGHPLPQTEGLTSEQMVKVLHELDYVPEVFYCRPKFSWWGVLYGYVSSRIPVILQYNLMKKLYPRHHPSYQESPEGIDLSGRHAVLVVGSLLATNHASGSQVFAGDGGRFQSFAHSVHSFLIHDDRYGPFGRLSIKPNTEGNVVSVEYPSGVIVEANLDTLVVPAPSGVNLHGAAAHRIGAGFLDDYTADFHLDGKLRTTLLHSTELKAACRAPRDQGWENAARVIRETAMSHWVWVTEAYVPHLPSPQKGSPVARVIMDATQLEHARATLALLAHVGDKVVHPR